jgi:uncharacterized protein (DUF1697 family)
MRASPWVSLSEPAPRWRPFSRPILSVRPRLTGPWAIFLKTPPPADLLDKVTGQAREEIAIGVREVYVHYPDGQADTKLKIPAASSGTARNMNTVAKLAELAS